VSARQAATQLRGLQGLPPRQAEKELCGVLPLPSREAETKLRGVQPLPSREAETKLRYVQSGTREFKGSQARAEEFARDQAGARDQT